MSAALGRVVIFFGGIYDITPSLEILQYSRETFLQGTRLLATPLVPLVDRTRPCRDEAADLPTWVSARF